jgi:FAD/FMN-containing dehydrogenase
VFGSLSFYQWFYVLLYFPVGKLRKRWVQSALSPTGVEMLRAIKDKIDPQNIFAINNLIPK